MVEVQLGELDAAGEKLSKIGGVLGGIDLATPVEGVPPALPNAATAPATLGVAVRLAAAVQVYTERVAELAAATRQCAVNYRASDDETAARFTELSRR